MKNTVNVTIKIYRKHPVFKIRKEEDLRDWTDVVVRMFSNELELLLMQTGYMSLH